MCLPSLCADALALICHFFPLLSLRATHQKAFLPVSVFLFLCLAPFWQFMPLFEVCVKRRYLCLCARQINQLSYLQI